MFETIANEVTSQRPVVSWPSPVAANAPESSARVPPSALWKQLLDEVDYGMLLISADHHVLYRNNAAHIELDSDHPLQVVGSGLRAQRAQDVVTLFDALAAAQRGLRRVITMGAGLHQVTISVVPLAVEGVSAAGMSPGQVLLVLGKRQVCGRLSLQGFARCMRLTPAETRVLELLCAGVRPGQIAVHQGVAVSTIRTQIGSIRAKTGAASISALVRQVALLPPMVGALRMQPRETAMESLAPH